jgi:hypothetical protein
MSPLSVKSTLPAIFLLVPLSAPALAHMKSVTYAVETGTTLSRVDRTSVTASMS